MLMIKRIIKWFKNLCMLYILNRKNNLKTKSKKISYKAKYGKHNVIGKNVYIDESVQIGDFTYINQNTSLENCIVGKYCSISEGVKINPTEHNLSLKTTHPIAGDSGHYGLKSKKVIIGNDVLISMNSIILSGVKIGNGAVIGAGAVVTKDVPPYAIVGGIPAKIIRKRFSDDEIYRLESLKWWDWPIKKIYDNIEFLRNNTERIK